MSLQFDNTEIAFRHKSDAKLHEAYWLFKAIENPALTDVGANFINFAFKFGLPIETIIRKTIFKHFCGGEDISGCLKVVDQLSQFGVSTILDYSAEAFEDDTEMEAATKEIAAAIQCAAEDDRVPFAVFKMTSLIPFSLLEKKSSNTKLDKTETQKFDAGLKRVRNLCEQSHRAKVPLLIDAEETWVQDCIDAIVYQMMREFNREQAIIFNTLQMYRHDRLAFLKQSIQTAKSDQIFYGAKLVRGAYMEKERERAAEKGYRSPIQPNKQATDKAFNDAIDVCVTNDNVSCFLGTHNESSTKLLAEKIAQQPDDPRFTFSQLYGMSDHLSFNLAAQGYRVAKYLPYGPVKTALPYLFRRAKENSSIAGQSGRELGLIKQELDRRKGK